MARRLPALSSLLVLCLVTVTWQGRTREGGGLRLDAGRSESWSARELERRNTMVVLRLLGGQPDRVEMLYWNSFKEAPGWNQTAELLGYNRALDDSSVQELAIKVRQHEFVGESFPTCWMRYDDGDREEGGYEDTMIMKRKMMAMVGKKT
eukprot:763856-Hanusia_phi.AAC.1